VYFSGIEFHFLQNESYKRSELRSDDTNQIFGGYKAYAYMNDIGRLGIFWAFSDNGKIDGIQIIRAPPG
jgi:hypothetical protein